MRGAGCPRVTQPFATLYTPEGVLTVRLACVRRAASVHPEPGSNSRFESPPGLPGEDSMEEVRTRPNPADLDSLGIELTFENFISNFAHSLSFVDLSIAVSGFQGSPPWASARGAGINYTHPGGPRGRGGDPPPIPHIPLPARAGAPETRGGGGPPGPPPPVECPSLVGGVEGLGGAAATLHQSHTFPSPRGPGPRKREEGEAPRDLPLLSNARRWSAASFHRVHAPSRNLACRIDQLVPADDVTRLGADANHRARP